MASSFRPFGLVLALGVVLAEATSAQSRPPDPASVDEVVAAAAAYVKDYQRALTSLLADEDYEQRIAAQIPLDRSMPSKRLLRSEVFFMFAPASGDWMAMRDVTALDGKPLTERPNLREALRTLSPLEVARTFKAYNSRFNLGHQSRNFNEPTLSLLLFDDRYRGNVRFTRKSVQRRPDGVWVTLGFTETAGPGTLIRDLSQNPAASKGEFVVDALTGRVRRAHMVTVINATPTSAGMTAEMTTTYAPDERLTMWVPVTFEERYRTGESMSFAPDPRIKLATNLEEIRGLAKYSNYRRFQVNVVIK